MGVITGSEIRKIQEKGNVSRERLMLTQLQRFTSAANAKVGMMLKHLQSSTWCCN